METEIPYTLLTRTKINSNLCQTSLTFVKEVDNGLEKIMRKIYSALPFYILRKNRAKVELNFLNHFLSY